MRESVHLVETFCADCGCQFHVCERLVLAVKGECGEEVWAEYVHEDKKRCQILLFERLNTKGERE